MGQARTARAAQACAGCYTEGAGARLGRLWHPCFLAISKAGRRCRLPWFAPVASEGVYGLVPAKARH